jgi:hypothetical protein
MLNVAMVTQSIKSRLKKLRPKTLKSSKNNFQRKIESDGVTTFMQKKKKP